MSIIAQLVILSPWRVASDWVVSTEAEGWKGWEGNIAVSLSLSLSQQKLTSLEWHQKLLPFELHHSSLLALRNKKEKQGGHQKKNAFFLSTVIHNQHHLSADEILIFFHGSTKATEKNVSWFPFKLLLTESRFKSKSGCTSSLSL